MFRDFNKYEVLADGRIWSKYSNKFLKPYTRKDGYQMVCLTDNEGKLHWQLVHKIVYFAVNGLWEYPEGLQINHKDENKCNNHITNLELCTPKENNNYGTRNERSSASQINNLERSKRVGAFKDGELVMVFPSTREAQRNGYNCGVVCNCCRNCYLREGNNIYKGYEWRYLDE